MRQKPPPNDINSENDGVRVDLKSLLLSELRVTRKPWTLALSRSSLTPFLFCFVSYDAAQLPTDSTDSPRELAEADPRSLGCVAGRIGALRAAGRLRKDVLAVHVPRIAHERA